MKHTFTSAKKLKFNLGSQKGIFLSFFLFILLTISSTTSFSQNPGITALNKKLRALFSPLSPPQPSKLFLYDMSAKTSDAAYWKNICTTTLEEDSWFEIYSDLYHAAYDTLLLQCPDTVYARYLRVDKKVVPLFIQNYDYNSFVDDALSSNKYFDFNIQDSTLSDKIKRSNPYFIASLFSAAPLDSKYPFSNPTFRIDPAFIFTDSYNITHFQNATNAVLKIDFDDGNGYVLIDPTAVHDYSVNYSSNGMKTLRTAIFNEKNEMLCYSQSKIKIISPYAAPVATANYDLPGIEASLYGPCSSSASMTGKLVIYLSGFDPLDMSLTNGRMSRHVDEIYTSMIAEDQIVQLKNMGYSFLVVDWKNSRTDIRFNALYLVNLIEKLKCDLEPDAQQFVIMGESMGGLVARFALTYMESKNYLTRNLSPFFEAATNTTNLSYLESHPEIQNLHSGWKNCYIEKRHNTRLLITIDSPHQGANIPLSLQMLYKGCETIFNFLPMGLQLKWIAKANNVALDGMAAKEMLYYHIDYYSGTNYYSAPEKNQFFTQLSQMGSYPKHAKLVALSNGSLQGTSQSNPYTAAVRMANDILVGIHLDKKISILGLKIPVFKCDAEFRTNPNGYGNFIHTSMGFYINLPVLYWFGIKFNSIFVNLIPNYTAAATVLPLCTNAGGYEDLTNKEPGEGGIFDKSWIYTDGTRFCFVPVQSALDYGVLGMSPQLGSDIENAAISVKLSQSPFDVLIGYPGGGIYTNNEHLSYRNPLIYNTAISAPSGLLSDKNYYSCTNESNTFRSILGLEIGDEELYLENCSLQWSSAYQAEFDIHVNEANRHYEYANFINHSFNEPGCYSKNNPFLIEPSASANFYYDSQNSATGIGLSYFAPYSGVYSVVDAPVPVCCHNFLGERIAFKSLEKISSEESKLSVSPNPLGKENLHVKFSNNNKAFYEMRLYDGFGKIIFIHMFTMDELNLGELDLNTSKLNLSMGIYFIQLIGEKQSLSTKFVSTIK